MVMGRKKSVTNRSGVGKASCDVYGRSYDGSKGWKHIKRLGLLCPKCARKKGYDPDRPGLHRIVRKKKGLGGFV